MTDNGCILCKLAKGELEASKVYEDDIGVAVMDIQPVNPGHILVFPKTCTPLMIDLPDGVIGWMFKTAKMLNKALRESGIRCEGINYFLADGKAAMQEIPHVHLHIFPRYAEDGFSFKYSDRYFQLPSRKELNELAEMIKAKL